MVARGRAISCLGGRAKELAFQETCTSETNTEATSKLSLQDNEGIETSPLHPARNVPGLRVCAEPPPAPTRPERPGRLQARMAACMDRTVQSVDGSE